MSLPTRQIPVFEMFLIVAAVVMGFLAVLLGWIMYLIGSGTVLRRTEIFVAEEYKQADIVVDLKASNGKIKAPWAAFAQGGEEPNKNMISGVEEKLAVIKPKYVRLDHIFDDDYYLVVSRQDGKLKANWSKLDEVVASIEKSGAKPFFSLGYMPKEIADSKISKPKNWSEWEWLVGELIKHYSGKNGKGIEDVYYEVWNEPDLETFGAWKYFGDKSYLTLYQYAGRAAKSLRNDNGILPFKFGGPATTALYKNWVVALENFAKKEKLPLDFISWHRYSYQPSQFRQDLKEVRSWVDDKRMEFIISEWGPDPEKTNIYSGYMAAAHAVASMRQMLDLSWGFAFEVKDGPGQGLQGWGIFTHDSAGFKTKPRYSVFNYLKNLSGERLEVKGEGSSVTGWAVKKSNGVSLILSNYSSGGGGKESFPVTFENMDAGSYQLKWEKLQGGSKEEIINIAEEGDKSIKRIFELAENNVIKIELVKIAPVKRIESTESGESEGMSSGFGRIMIEQQQ
jgi:hypothetical protein